MAVTAPLATPKPTLVIGAAASVGRLAQVPVEVPDAMAQVRAWPTQQAAEPVAVQPVAPSDLQGPGRIAEEAIVLWFAQLFAQLEGSCFYHTLLLSVPGGTSHKAWTS